MSHPAEEIRQQLLSLRSRVDDLISELDSLFPQAAQEEAPASHRAVLAGPL